MAVVLLDNLPLPTLQSYTIGSLLLFVVACVCGYQYNSEIWSERDQTLWGIIVNAVAKDPFCFWVSTINNCTIWLIFITTFAIIYSNILITASE